MNPSSRRRGEEGVFVFALTGSDLEILVVPRRRATNMAARDRGGLPSEDAHVLFTVAGRLHPHYFSNLEAEN